MSPSKTHSLKFLFISLSMHLIMNHVYYANSITIGHNYYLDAMPNMIELESEICF